MIPGITEEDEEEDDEMEDLEVEEVDHFGAEAALTSDLDVAVDDTFTEPVSPLTPLPPGEHEKRELDPAKGGGVPLTAEALAKMEEEEEELDIATEMELEKKGFAS
jgi:hypothetical protein